MEGGTLPPYEPKSEKAENKTETVEKDKPSACLLYTSPMILPVIMEI